MQHQVALANQPLIDGEAPHHGPRAVIAHHHHHRVLIEPIQQAGDFPVQVDIVIVDGVLVGIAWHVLGVPRVHVLPHAVVDAVHPHLHEHEEVPRLVEQVVEHPKALAGHAVDVVQEFVLVLSAEVSHVELVGLAPEHVVDFFGQGRGVGPLSRARRREEGRHQPAVDRAHGICLGHAHHDRA